MTITLPHIDRETASMLSWKLSAVGMILLTCLMANIVTKLEASFKTVAFQATMNVAPPIYATAYPPEDTKLQKEVQKDVEILRDSFLLSWMVGGCVLGSCVGIWIRALTEMVEIAKTFGVSLFSSFCVGPWAIQNYCTPAPSTCIMVGFFMAVAAWVAWEVALAIASRIKVAAIKGGWLAVKAEVFGGQAIITQESQPTRVSLPPPPQPRTPTPTPMTG